MAFVEQTTVDRILTIALNAIDKPEVYQTSPEVLLRREMERVGRHAIEQAMARCRELLGRNPRDFVAAGAERLLQNVLSH